MAKPLYRYLFRDRDGEMVPAIPQRRPADGKTLFSLEQAAKISGWNIETLKRKWDDLCGDYEPSEDMVYIDDGLPRAEPPSPPKVLGKSLEDVAGSSLVYKVDDEAFRTIVTKEQLFDCDGRPAMGLCIESAKLILISSHYPPDTWEKTWFHEAHHARENRWPRPEEIEAGIEWNTTFLLDAHQQYQQQGGRNALMAMQPIAGLAPLPAAKPVSKYSDTEALLRRNFAHLPEDVYWLARKKWEARGLSPWLDHFFIAIDYRGTAQQDVRVIMKLPGMRFIAGESPDYRGRTLPVFTYGEDKRRPVSCVVIIKRKIGDDIVEFPAEAFWDDVYGEDAARIPQLVLDKPRDCLAAIAEVKALSVAYAHKLHDIQAAEERVRPITYGAAARTAPRH